MLIELQLLRVLLNEFKKYKIPNNNINMYKACNISFCNDSDN